MSNNKELKTAEFRNGEVFIFTDTHFSAKYQGSHRAYLESSYKIMAMIIDKLEKAPKVAGVIFLGDLIGVKEQNIQDHQFLGRVVKFFTRIKSICGGQEAVSVKGNHDYGDFTDFQLLEMLGVLSNPDYVDYYPEDGMETPEIRFHIVNYGEEDRAIDFAANGPSNVVLAHNDFQISGVTNWFPSRGGILLDRQLNWEGVNMVLSGHIHNPSPELLPAYIGSDNNPTWLFYLGSPARVSERIDDSFYVRFFYNKKGGYTEYDMIPFGLWPVEEEFYPKEELISLESEEERIERVESEEQLKKIIEELQASRIIEGDIVSQINKMKMFSPESIALAESYYKAAASA